MNQYKNYINDSLILLIERANEAKQKNKSDFENGVLMGYYHAITLLLNQASAFRIDSDLRPEVKDFDPDVLIAPASD